MGKAWETPMMKQWSELKRQAGDHLLFFRLGDFYELFSEDAVKAAPLMGVTLTARNSKAEQEEQIPLCGVPIHHFEMYAHKLLDRGQAIALAEQTEEASNQKSLVERAIVQWLTPGMRLLAHEDRPHYLAVVSGKLDKWSLAACDVGTGHVLVESGSGNEALLELIQRLPIEDCRIPYGQSFELSPKLFQRACHLSLPAKAKSQIMEAFCLSSMEDLPLHSDLELQVLGSLVQIAREAHPRERLRFLHFQDHPDAVWMGASTRRHLHLFEPKEKNLFQCLDETQTAFGRRELKEILAYPTNDREKIFERQEVVQFFKRESSIRLRFRKQLGQIYDLERLFRKARKPRALYQISESLSRILSLKECFKDCDLPRVKALLKSFQPLETGVKALVESLQWSDEKETGWIKAGVSRELDELRDFAGHAEKALSDFELQTREALDISNLKVKFHQSFGYILEVPKSQREKIPEEAKRVQSLTQAERFKLKELESFEEKLLSLDARIREAENAEIEKLYDALDKDRAAWSQCLQQLAQLDCLQGFAEISQKQNWSRPRSSEKTQHLHLKKARHPLMEEDFVPLSLDLEKEGMRSLLLTGPNMAGKSTVLRVAGLCALLHQIGSDVPAAEAELSLFDRIMCRMGAQDDLIQGKSTFYVEMKEVAQMLLGAGPESLLLFDEIGRGTSTYDGMSLAWAISEEVIQRGGLSMIATHYLELAQLENLYPALHNYHLGVKESAGKLLFTRRLERGPASRSYGIQVARLAELPEVLLQRAEKKLREFEKKTEKKSPLFAWAERQSYVQ